MKLSEFKKEIIKEFGEKGWNNLKRTIEYKTYTSTEEEQLEAIKEDCYIIEDINNPTEEMQLEAIKTHLYMVDRMCNPSEKVLIKIIKKSEDINDVKRLFKHIENDLEEE